MTGKIFKSIISVAAIVLVSAFVIIMGCLYDYFSKIQRSQMKDELNLAYAAVEGQGIDYLKKLNTGHYRITWIDDNGNVLYDSKNNAYDMENHIAREEIKEAFKKGEGESVRFSSTLMEQTMYYAKRLRDGSVLRISLGRASIGFLLMGMMRPVIIVMLIAIVLSAVLAGRLSKKIVKPINNLDLEHPLDNDIYEEIAPLLNRINKQHEKISAQLSELEQKKDEFTHVTHSMKEGLVLLDSDFKVLSINPSAQSIFGVRSDCIGEGFITVDRSSELNNGLKKAVENGHCEIHSKKNGFEYQFDISSIEYEGGVIGAVILAFDVTEQEFAQQNRREFTANVSHELKTPLQGIMGSAELIENGMVDSKDLPRFMGHIRREASRLVTLIEDIIQLSQLDEEKEFTKTDVDIMSVANEVAADLKPAADKKGINVSLKGDNAHITGVYRLIYEIVYNLCDNAIKYNKANGNVYINVASDDENCVLTVSDTGEGIPREYHSRIFERFYRVDKSHSKLSGGTGLGLSIVKHAAEYHKAKITLESEVGKGTEITLTFPRSNEKSPI